MMLIRFNLLFPMGRQAQQRMEEQERRRLDSESRVQNEKLAEQIHEEQKRRAELIRLAHERERIERQKAEENLLMGGALGKVTPGLLVAREGSRSITFDLSEFGNNSSSNSSKIDQTRKGALPSQSTWVAYGPPCKADPLWTCYDVEAANDVSHLLPTYDTVLNPDLKNFDRPHIASLLVIDFMHPYYRTSAGQLKIKSLINDVAKVRRISHKNLSRVLACKVSTLFEDR